MSFLVELDVEGVTPDQGEAVEAACAERDAWPIGFFRGGPRKRFLRKPKVHPPGLSMPDEIDELPEGLG